MPDTASITIADFDGQQGIFGVNCVDINAANYAAQAAFLTALKDSLPAIIDGIPVSQGFSVRARFQVSGFKAPDPNAQRGNKWLVHTHDTATELGVDVPNPSYLKPFTYEVPTADLSLRIANRDIVWQNGAGDNVAAFDPFVEAFEDFAKSPNGGALQVDYIDSVTVAGG